MGTRGFISFAVDGQLKTAYNHYDSYPDSLGLKVLRWLRDATKDPAGLRRAIQLLRVVPADSKPAQADITRLERWADTRVSSRQLDEWYVLLRGTQGDPGAILSAGVIEDASSFPADSLFAEWGYVADLDGDGLFEVYKGFQQSRHSSGRFASEAPDEHGYYPVALIQRWPLAELPSGEEFMDALAEADEE